MRVLIVTVVHHPADARIAHRQIPALLAAGDQVTYAAPFTERSSPPPPGVLPVDLPAARGRRRLMAVRAARRLLAQRGDQDDVVLLHDPELLWSVGRSRTPVIWDVHEDTAAALGMRSWLPSVLRPAARRAIARLERRAEQRHSLLLAEESYQERFRLTHPVVPNTTWVPETCPALTRPDQVVHLGTLTSARGVPALLQLAAGLRSAGLHLRLIGQAHGSAAPEVGRAAAAGLLEWSGFLPNAEATAALDGALAGVALLTDEPNYRHSRPTKILEYFAHGLPVVSTSLPCADALLRDSGAGAVIDQGPPAQVAAAALTILREWRADLGLRDRLGMAGHRYALAHHAWQRDGIAFVRAVHAAARP
ncbi:MAG: glycosyltransferase [Actinomycetales bacterium]|nr:glycosyltransferase [Actinomycetales bacterium]